MPATKTYNVTGNREDLGIILKSPNGTRYKLTVDNGGSLVVTAV